MGHRAKWGTGPNGAQGQPNIFSPLDLYFFHDRKNHILESKIKIFVDVFAGYYKKHFYYELDSICSKYHN